MLNIFIIIRLLVFFIAYLLLAVSLWQWRLIIFLKLIFRSNIFGIIFLELVRPTLHSARTNIYKIRTFS